MEMISLTDDENESYPDQTNCHMCKTWFEDNYEKYYKVRDHCHETSKQRGAGDNMCNIR